MMHAEALSAGYGGRVVIHGVALHAEQGSITAVIGPNGAGKSTLLKALAGMLPPCGGSVQAGGKPLHQLSSKDKARLVAFLSQRHTVPAISMRTLVLHGRFPHMGFPRKPSHADYAIAEEAMRDLGVLHLQEELLTELSGGEVQKAYLAMALAQQTPVLILDEPNTYLDVFHQRELMRTLRELADRGKTILLAVHDIPTALEFADAVCVMQHGEVVFNGAARALPPSGLIQKVFGVDLHILEKEGRQFYSMA